MNPAVQTVSGAPYRIALVNISPWYQDGQATTIQRSGRYEVSQRIALDSSAADLLLQQQPDLIFVSIPVARPDWIEILMRIRVACPWAYLITATAEPDWRAYAGAQRDGANCVLVYPLTDALLLSALEEGARTLDRRAASDPVFQTILALSPTLRRVASVLSTGASNPMIADALCLSRNTVERHISALLRAFDVSGRVPLSAMLACLRSGPKALGSTFGVPIQDAATAVEVH